jgi:hypothetical protein
MRAEGFSFNGNNREHPDPALSITLALIRDPGSLSGFDEHVLDHREKSDA